MLFCRLSTTGCLLSEKDICTKCVNLQRIHKKSTDKVNGM